MFMRVVIIRKVDLDTCLTALLMGVNHDDNLVVSKNGAMEEDIRNPLVLCIEAGGSGLVDLNNFDHHNTDRKLQPACKQAYQAKGRPDAGIMERVIEYVCIVDDRPWEHPLVKFPSLSNLFSGMLLVESSPAEQLFNGLDILKTVLKMEINPFAPMPDLTKWRSYEEAKQENMQKVEKIIKTAEFFVTNSGVKLAFLESTAIGGISALYEKACRLVLLYNPSFGNTKVRKFTIAGNRMYVDHLLPLLNNLEPGWGGRETIIGSPGSGSGLSVLQVLKLITEHA